VTTSRTAQVLRSLLARPDATPKAGAAGTEDVRPVVTRLLQTLRDHHAQHATTFVVVFLPVRSDYDDDRADAWRRVVRDAAAGQIPVVDLVGELRALPRDEVDRLFIAPGESFSPLSEGHYSGRGHDFVARRLLETISNLDVLKIPSSPDARPR
jgi:hypothetical protein